MNMAIFGTDYMNSLTPRMFSCSILWFHIIITRSYAHSSNPCKPLPVQVTIVVAKQPALKIV